MKTCRYCGKEFEQGYTTYDCSEECFLNNYWDNVLDDEAIIINGICYHDGGRKPDGYKGFLGHDGRRWIIQMNDGRIIDTNNLWYNAVVPAERYTGDNAVFLGVFLPITKPYKEDKTI